MDMDAKSGHEKLWGTRGGFTLNPARTALVVVDVQYATASRSAGKGKMARDSGLGGQTSYRFDRIEKIMVPNIQKLLKFFRDHRLRIVYLTNGSEMPDYSDCLPHRRLSYQSCNNTKGNREHEILDEIKPLPGECVINKTTSSAFNSTNIDLILGKGMGVGQLVFAGVSTDACVENTARDAVDLGYQCLMVEDGCACNKEVFHKSVLAHFADRFGRVASTVDVIQELGQRLR